jgi:hypothetical protein
MSWKENSWSSLGLDGKPLCLMGSGAVKFLKSVICSGGMIKHNDQIKGQIVNVV